MKILAIDSQKLVLISLQQSLTLSGYQVKIANTAREGIELIDSFEPNLVILDTNMPDISGLEILKYIKKLQNTQVSVIVLTSDTNSINISKAFELGVDFYLKKPLSIDEILIRTKKLIGKPESFDNKLVLKKTLIQEHCVGVVIPCYNEEKRLLSNEFLDFVDRHSGYHLCFVNDGSTDNTLEVLNKLRETREVYISVHNCEKNGGKAEAVRQGMLNLVKHEDLDYIGFLDADLSTNLSDFDMLVKTIQGSEFKIVSGSRITRIGANITKDSARKIISLSVNFIIRKILSLEFNDTQCGAKIFHRDVIHVSFGQKFISQWVFDVEIFKRITLKYGLKKSKKMLCEKPLERWIHADGSKLSMKDSVKIIFQLLQINFVYSKKRVHKFYKMKRWNNFKRRNIKTLISRKEWKSFLKNRIRLRSKRIKKAS